MLGCFVLETLDGECIVHRDWELLFGHASSGGGKHVSRQGRPWTIHSRPLGVLINPPTRDSAATLPYLQCLPHVRFYPSHPPLEKEGFP